ncbi:hypothetical protein BU15DRAFT_69020 [Melanogaster broomeanus]|nr:hypothetical protein BU15DRAFT_69020 [Melanogaster broomeanus]
MCSHNADSPTYAMQPTSLHDDDNPTRADTATHPSVPLSAGATSHNDDNPTGATQQHIHLCHSRPVQQATTMTTQRVQHSSTSICAPNAPACTTGHCGLYSAIATTQRSHAPDDTTQPHNAPARCTTPQHAAHPHLHTIMAQPQAIEDAICPAWVLWPRQRNRDDATQP